jgi:carbamoyl-phosphate synthase small subunit
LILPFDTEPEKILQMNLSAVLLSNGPGDPAVLRDVIKNITNLLGNIDIFGICLGHQLLALALGYETRIMPFGHRGANHPVIDLRTKQVIITTQNHGYEIDESSIDGNVFITHRNLHDNSIEGIMSLKYNARSVQFHPEAAPGTNDAKVIFKDWFSGDL